MDKFLYRTKKPRCQKSVWRSGEWGSSQCSRAAKPGSDFCKVHNPAAEAERDAVRKARSEEQWAERRLEIHGKHFYAALEKIAAGHNDPRGLAQEVINEFNKSSIR